MNWMERFVGRLVEGEVRKRASLERQASVDMHAGVERHAMAVAALDDRRDRMVGGESTRRDRRGYDRLHTLEEALEAWRVNPLARRIVGLTSQYVVGGGIKLACQHPETHAFLQAWWEHPLNRMAVRCYEWCDELTRSGELFIALSTGAAGMSYLRAVPAAEIQEIETAPNDLEQELAFWEQAHGTPDDQIMPDGRLGGRRWQAYQPELDLPGEDGSFPPVMLHFAVNRPVGAKFGESDLAPLLRWLSRYAAWLEDRARLNRYRNSFLYQVQARYQDEAERARRQAELNLNPPAPGSILVTDESETWSVINPQLASFEAAEDGLALKKMVAAGSGNPLHFLAEAESATRTTAESAGGPTFRHYEQRQQYFLWLVQVLARAVLRRRALVDRGVDAGAELQVRGADITARDNGELAQAASAIIAAFSSLHERGLIEDEELLRLAYRFAGETYSGKIKSVNRRSPVKSTGRRWPVKSTGRRQEHGRDEKKERNMDKQDGQDGEREDQELYPQMTQMYADKTER